MKTLVCGGRDFGDAGRVFRVLDAIHAKRGVSCIIHGDASGAEHCALAAGYDDCAGRMEQCDCVLPGTAISLVVAFPGGVGTAHMVKLAKTAGIEVVNG